MASGFWFGTIGGDIPGNKFANFILLKFPDSYLIFGFPLILTIIALINISLLAYFEARIGDFNLKLGYCRILKKLKYCLLIWTI
jgi:hypothetical protein